MAKAFLTHSFHCCAFKFPEQHDPLSHEKFLKVIDEFKNDCKSKGYHQVGDIKNVRKLKRSHDLIDLIHANNNTKMTLASTFYDDSQGIMDYEIEGFDGVFHAPIVVNNNQDIEALCGNITIQLVNYPFIFSCINFH